MDHGDILVNFIRARYGLVVNLPALDIETTLLFLPLLVHLGLCCHTIRLVNGRVEVVLACLKIDVNLALKFLRVRPRMLILI